ncbi:hypothetical protein ACHQM5_030713 [Ranunculus cassubicifolius]
MEENNIVINRIPQSKYIDAIRWIPSQSPSHNKFIAMALYSSDDSSSSIEIHSLVSNQQPFINLLSTWSSPSRISSLRSSIITTKPLISASTFQGSLHFLFLNPNDDNSIQSQLSLLPNKSFHVGPISGIDLFNNHCVTVGEDGRVNLTSLRDDSSLHYQRVYDSQGLASYTSVKWASPAEFATGGLGFSLQWWDQRKPGAALSTFKDASGSTSGMIHSIDIHESRKHVCVAGGSLGNVFAWDLRRPGQPIVLSSGSGGSRAQMAACDGEVWEVQYDSYKQSNSSRVLTCSEDGVVALIQQGNEPVEIMAEPCAVNSLDIDPQNPAEVICSLEWESVALITRQ